MTALDRSCTADRPHRGDGVGARRSLAGAR